MKAKTQASALRRPAQPTTQEPAMFATPQPRATVTLDDLAAIATRIEPFTRSANPGDTRATRHIEAIFASYGITFSTHPPTRAGRHRAADQQ